MKLPNLELKDKIALVTASAQGIGRSIAEMFAYEGAKVFATDINKEKVSTLSKIEGITPLELDVTDIKKIDLISQQFNNIDILVNCAGYVHSGSILECTEEEWDFGFNLNVKGMYNVTKVILPIMEKEKKGSIINMSSVASSIKGVKNRFIYSTTKAAVIGFTKSIATDFISQNVRCNAICPGTIDTPSLHDRLEATGDFNMAMKEFISRQPLGRIGTSLEVAHLATYLASDKSKFTTGQTHIIDGGWSM
jgi:2-keto-3-deoxy-L-fuconate dehydrogenase